MAWQARIGMARKERGALPALPRADVGRGLPARLREAVVLLAVATTLLGAGLTGGGMGVIAAEPTATPADPDSPMTRALAAYAAIQAASALPPDWSPASVAASVAGSVAVTAAPAGFLWPAPGTLTQGYGCTGFAMEPWSAALGCHFHEGLDIANVEGTAVSAVAAGQVAWAGWTDDGYGYSVQLDHGGGLTTRYGHLCCVPVVAIGQRVARGELIGLMGTTGASTGPHLHFTVHLNGAPVDPWGYLG